MSRKYVPALRFAFLTPAFDRFMKYLFPERRLKADLLRHALESGAGTVLDFACGTGTFAVALKAAEPDLRVTGLDIDAAVLDLANKKAAAAALEIAFDLYGGGELPYRDGSSTWRFPASRSTIWRIPTSARPWRSCGESSSGEAVC